MRDVPQPTFETPRLRLRPFCASDAPTVQALAGDRAIAATTASIPHPYEDGMAEAWIAGHPDAWRDGESASFAVFLRYTGDLVGAVGLTFEAEHRRAELGYWVARAAWGQGYATEAAQALLDWALGGLRLERIHARSFAGNAASAGVLRKLGFREEGVLRRHFVKWGTAQDLVMWGVLREEWEAGRA